jgi:membrane fusion protein (multidrug efflux system)
MRSSPEQCGTGTSFAASRERPRFRSRCSRIAAACAVLTAALHGASALAAPDDPPGVIVAEARIVDFPLTVEALGTTRANESVDIRPLGSQRIVSIRFKEGEQVEAGRVLVELQSAEARADVASARATLSESESHLRRARELYRTKAVSASELDQRETRRDADKAALDAAHARFADTSVRAPFAGVLGLRRVSLGSYVTPNTVITTLDDIATVKLDFGVPETVLARLAPGLPIVARSAAWPGVIFEGSVASIDTRVDPISRTLAVRAVLPNDKGRLRPGMFLTVILTRDEISALVVPEPAIVPERSRQFVLVVGAGDVVERREIKTGRRKPGWVEVREGLSAGEVVIIEGTQKALPDKPVRIVERRNTPLAPVAAEGAQ